MGTKLGELIKPIREITTLEALQGRMFAVDANNMLYQFISIMRDQDGTPLQWDNRPTGHLIGILNRTTRLITDFGIKLVLVFDGIPHQLKHAELERRKQAKIKAEKAWIKARELGNRQIAFTKAVATSRLTKNMISDAKYLLTLLGIPFIDAPQEAEAQTAFMVQTDNRFWGANSHDYDSLLFGCPRQVRYLSISGKYRNIHSPSQPDIIELPRLLAYHNITRNQLIDFGILLGTDFNEKVPRVGPKTGLRLIHDHNSLEEMPEKIRAQLPDNYEEIRQLFLQPKITTEYTIDFGTIQEEELVTFLCQKRGFAINQVQSVINRIKQATTQKTQVGLERWL